MTSEDKQREREVEMAGKLMDDMEENRVNESMAEQACREWLQRKEAHEAQQQGDTLSQFYEKVRSDHGQRMVERR